MADLLHALIIEDSENDAELIRHFLQKDGFDLVSDCVDTLDGLKAALKKPGWEVIISDYNLPGFNAATTLAMLQESGDDIPFIIVSGKIEEETAIELMRNGAADYLMKDKMARLAPVVRRELQEAQIRRERRETEIALVESNRRFRMMFDQSPYGVLIIDPTTGFAIDYNSIAHQQLGYKREEFAQVRISDYEVDETPKEISHRILDVLQNRNTSFETRHRTKFGTIRNIHISVQPIVLANRTYLHTIYQDITEQKQAEESLQESESRYHDLFENSAMPTFVEDFSEVDTLFEEIRASGVTDMRAYFEQHPEQVVLCAELVKIVDVNQATLRYFGSKSKGKVSFALPLYFTEKSWPVFREEVIALAEGASHFASDISHLNLNKEERIFSLTLSVDPGHKTSLSRVLVTFTDITEHRKTEERIKAEHELLQICNYANSGQELLHKLMKFFINFTGCEAVGIRLHDDGDYPYFETRGFPETFVKAENSLCSVDALGEILRDDVGNPVLDCICGNILCARFDSSKNFFTKHGSFWSGNTTHLLASTTDADRMARTRNRCNGEGYESVALIPIRIKDRTFGLFQFNDKRVGWHTLEKIKVLEHLVDYVAIALAKQETDAALTASEEKFKYIFNNSVVGKSITLPTGEIQTNNSFCDMVGYSQAELTGGKWQEITHPDDIELTQKMVNTLLSGEKERVRFTKRFIHKNGSIVWADLGSGLRRDKDGKPLYLMTSISDITERKKAEDALIESEERLRDVLDNSLDAAYKRNLQTNVYDYLSPVFEQISGYTPKEFNSLPMGTVLNLTHPDDVAEIERVIAEATSSTSAAAYQVTYRFKHKNGQYRWLQDRFSVIRNAEGQLQAFIGSVSDITTRKKSEEALLKSETLLNETQRLSKIGGWEYDLATRTMYWSDEVYRIHGFLLDEAAAVSADLIERSLSCYHPEDRLRIDSAFKQCVSTGRSYELEVRFISEPGEHKWVRTTGNSVLENGKVVRVTGNIVDITEQKLAELALSEAHWRAESIIEGTHAGTWEWNIQTGETIFNEEWAQIIGYTLDELAPISIQTWEKLVHPDDLKRSVELLERHFAGELPYYDYECRMKHKDGRWVWIQDRGRVSTRTADGKPLMMFGTHTDITNRKQAEEALREAHWRAESIIDGANVGTWEWNIRTGEAVFNEIWAEILGFTLDELAPISIKTWEKFGHPDDRKTIAKLRDQHFKGELAYYDSECRMKHKDGRWVWIHSRGRVMTRTEDGKPLMMFGTHTDITERKQVEAAIHLAQWRLESIIEGTHAGTWEWNVQTGEQVFNETWAEIIGYTLDELAPTSSKTWEKFAHPDDFQRSAELLEQHFAGELPYYDCECRMKHKDGRWVWVHSRGRVMTRTEDGKPLMMFGTHSDITERKQVEEALREEDNILKQMVLFTEELIFTGTQPVEFQKIIDNLLLISGAKYGAITLLDETTGKFTTVAVAGVADKLKQVSKILGFEIIGREWDEYSSEKDHQKGKTVSRFTSLSDLAGRVLTEIVTRPIENIFNIGEIFVTKIMVNEQMIGDFTLIMPSGRHIKNEPLIEIYSRQIDLFITRKYADEKLRNREQLLENSQKTAHLGSYLLDFEKNTNLWSKETYRIFGLDENGPPPTNDEYAAYVHGEDRNNVYAMLENSINSNEIFNLTYRIIRADGEMRFVHSIGNPETNSAGKVIRLIGTIQDVTESKELEIALEASLEEKEVLLKEVHHRVKNNLASILGLLELERQTLADPTADTLLRELGNRIKSMATIHEKLYRSPSLSKIDFEDYLKSFVSHLRTSLLTRGDVITRVEAKNVELSLDLAVPCGLIVNELVTNALKYAFPKGKPGAKKAKTCEISVSMSVIDTAYTITVTDNGVGFPADLDWRNAKTLGLRLITMLGEHQLGGVITLDCSNGTKFTLNFDPRHRVRS